MKDIKTLKDVKPAHRKTPTSISVQSQALKRHFELPGSGIKTDTSQGSRQHSSASTRVSTQSSISSPVLTKEVLSSQTSGTHMQGIATKPSSLNPPDTCGLSAAALKMKETLVRDYLAKHKEQKALRAKAEEERAKELAIEEVKKILLESGETPDPDFFSSAEFLLAGSSDITSESKTNKPTTSTPNSNSGKDDYETPTKKSRSSVDPMDLLQNKEFISALKETLVTDVPSCVGQSPLDLSSIKRENSDSTSFGSSCPSNVSPLKIIDNNALKTFFSKGSKKKKSSKLGKSGSAPNSPTPALVSPSPKSDMPYLSPEQLRAMTEQKLVQNRELRKLLQIHCNTRTYNPLVGKLHAENYKVLATDLDDLPSDNFYRTIASHCNDLRGLPDDEQPVTLRKKLARFIALQDAEFARVRAFMFLYTHNRFKI